MNHAATPPPQLRVAAALVAAQGAALVAAAAVLVVEMVVATADDLVTAAALAAMALLAGVGLLVAGRGLGARRRWARSPALVTQLFVVPVSFSLLGGSRWYVGVPLLVWAAVVLVLLLTPAVGGALGEGEPDDTRG